MDGVEASSYWCHMCSQTVSPIMEVESVKCPICRGGFVEEMASAADADAATPGTNVDDPFDFGGSDSDRSLSLWAPILLGMMSNPVRHRRLRSLGFEEDVEDDVPNENNNVRINNHHYHHHHQGLGMVLDRDVDPGVNVSRRRATNVLHLLHGIRAAMQPSPENSEDDHRGRNERDRRDGQRVILINPFNQTIAIQGSNDSNGNSQNVPIGSLGDYFFGPGLDLLLQHLSENDPNRYGTPPAKKDAVEALPDVKIEGSFQCSVCLDEFENGCQAKEMPCKHKFHSACILPWLELHSSCPVCRYQLPSDESKINDFSRNNSSNEGSRREEGDREGRNENGGRFSLTLPWPFTGLFTPSGSEHSNGNSASTSSAPSTNAPPSNSHAHDD